MGLPFILVLCLGAVFCLAPLTVYLFWLAILTKRDHPTLVSGPWDFAGLVLGLSGFIVFGGGLVLSLLQSNFRYWMRGNFEALRAAWGQEKVTWLLLSGLFLLSVAAWVGLTATARRKSIVAYNVDPAAFESTLVEVFENLNRPVERRGNLWVGGVPLCELDRFVAGRTVTLRWISEDRLLFQDVDRLLREAVPRLASDDNPATRWLIASAIGAGSSAVACFGLLVYALSLFR